MDSSQKIVIAEKIEKIANDYRNKEKKIITTNGAFDILHAGHVQFLEQARTLGDILIVGLNSDASIKLYKGDKRPINSEEDRAIVLSALECVSYVVIFEEREPSRLLEKIKPNIHVKGGDYTLNSAEEQPHTRVYERSVVEYYGGKVRILPILEGMSTTQIIKKIVEAYGNR